MGIRNDLKTLEQAILKAPIGIMLWDENDKLIIASEKTIKSGKENGEKCKRRKGRKAEGQRIRKGNAKEEQRCGRGSCAPERASSSATTKAWARASASSRTCRTSKSLILIKINS